MSHSHTKKGFTLIELMVVVGIISIFSALITTSLDESRGKARVTRAKQDLRQLQTAMNIYLSNREEFPPQGDHCSACSNPCGSSWVGVVDVLVDEGLLQGRIDKDPWGHYYCYDDNYKVNNCAYETVLWSMGPNGARDTSWGSGPPVMYEGDDIGIVLAGPRC